MIINFICILIGVLIGVLIGMLYTIHKQLLNIENMLEKIHGNIGSVIAVNPWGNKRYIRMGKE